MPGRRAVAALRATVIPARTIPARTIPARTIATATVTATANLRPANPALRAARGCSAMSVVAAVAGG